MKYGSLLLAYIRPFQGWVNVAQVWSCLFRAKTWKHWISFKRRY